MVKTLERTSIVFGQRRGPSSEVFDAVTAEIESPPAADGRFAVLSSCSHCHRR
jgi:hypothetical protein